VRKNKDKIIQEVTENDYKYGFVTDIAADSLPKGLNENIVREIWKRKKEPEFMLDFRMKAFR